MKIRFLRSGILLLSLILLLSACSPIVGEIPETLSVYASFYPIYALADMILQDIPNLELHCLVQPQDGCLRSYELSDWDRYLLGYSANIILTGGCGLEGFSETLKDSNLALAEVLRGLELYEGKVVSDEGSHFSGSNPHLYMSVAGAVGIAENIVEAMSVLDARYAENYETNLENATRLLRDLQSEITQITEHLHGSQVIVMNEALIYSAADYGLEVEKIFERESNQGLFDSELEDCLEELSACNSNVVLIENQAPESLVQALESAGYTVAKLNVFSTGRESDGCEGYFESQRANAYAVADAFSRTE